MNNEYIVGIDIGGTGIRAALLINGQIDKMEETPTGAHRTREEILKSLHGVISKIWHPNVKSIGVGSPGFIDTTKGVIIKINNIPSWNGLPLKEILQTEWGVPTFVNNDANCFLLGEKYFGCGKPYASLLGLTLGTGLGGAVVIHHKLHTGLACGAGEFGCMPYLQSTYESYCGSQFFVREFQLSAKELYDKARQKDAMALDAFHRFGRHLGKLISNLLYTLAPEAIVIGGSISNAFPYFEGGIREELDNFLLPEVKDQVWIGTSQLEHPALMGAAALYYDSKK